MSNLPSPHGVWASVSAAAGRELVMISRRRTSGPPLSFGTMLIKAADDRTADINALEALLTRPGVDASATRAIELELRRVKAGIRGEQEAAYEIEFHYGQNPNRMTIHDLRFGVEGRVAQIDHLLIDRLLGIWVCESKHFSEGVAVDEFGEWTGFYNHRPFGIGSPIEQNRKHIAVLNDVFSKRLVELPRRLGIAMKPEVRGLVLVSKTARISRPKTKAARSRIPGLESVVKVDQLKPLLDGELDAKGVAAFRRLVSASTVEALARQLAALHRPANVDWAAKFGLPASAPEPAIREVSATAPAPRANCESCERPVSQAVVEFCQARSELFGDRTLCMDCQRKVRRGQI